MNVSDLIFSYPEALVATAPSANFRTLLVSPGEDLRELGKDDIFALFGANDLLVVNDTRVLKRRVFTPAQVEVLFVKALDAHRWEVLFPARKLKVGDNLPLPGGRSIRLLEKGIPQLVETDVPLTDAYFEEHGELALPPYIQKARGARHTNDQDQDWYQTDWAQHAGSSAAPTASLHFDRSDLARLQERGVRVASLTLHVGLGTFLPVRSESLDEHKMHHEPVSIPPETVAAIEETKRSGGRVWALGTTVTRSLEAWARGHLQGSIEQGFRGETDIFIKPPFEFKVVDVLMTNFHQPGSTLLALVAAFAGLERTLQAYKWAVDHEFRLFSYGDLSIWLNK